MLTTGLKTMVQTFIKKICSKNKFVFRFSIYWKLMQDKMNQMKALAWNRPVACS